MSLRVALSKPFHDPSVGKNRLPIHGITARNLPDIAAVLLSGGADANGADGDGWCPVHIAAAMYVALGCCWDGCCRSPRRRPRAGRRELR